MTTTVDNVGSRIWLKVVGVGLAFMILPVAGLGTFADARTLSGIIYFTNNTPPHSDTFPVQLFSLKKKKRLATANRSDHQRFQFTGVKPGKYLLKFTWPHRCVLWYRVDLTKESQTEIRIIMDAACAHADGAIQDLPAR